MAKMTYDEYKEILAHIERMRQALRSVVATGQAVKPSDWTDLDTLEDGYKRAYREHGAHPYRQAGPIKPNDPRYAFCYQFRVHGRSTKSWA